MMTVIKQDMRRFTRPGWQIVSIAWLLVVCAGCPPPPPSQEEQRRAVTSHWITVEPASHGDNTQPVLDQHDFAAICNVPAIVTAVGERLRSATIASDDHSASAVISATGPEYLQLLKEGARVKVLEGRFLEPAVTNDESAAIVLSESLATALFLNAEPTGRSVVLAGQKLTVIGVVTDGASWGRSLTRDAYVALTPLVRESDGEAAAQFDRFRLRVSTLDQVRDVQEFIQKMMGQRHPNQPIRVISFFSEGE